MKALVLYYSYEGHTKKLAEVIAQSIHADLEGIQPLHEMKSHGVFKYVWGGRQSVMKSKPHLQPINADIEGYDVIFIGSPVWAFNYAPPIRTLMHMGLIKDKQVAFFCTCDGGCGRTIDKFKKLVQKENHFLGGMDFLNDGENILKHKKIAVSWAVKCVKDML